MAIAPTRPSNQTTQTSTATKKTFSVSGGLKHGGQLVVLYGVAGIGKTSLAALAPSPVFIDIDSNGTAALDVKRVEGVKTFADVLEALRTESLWKDARTVVIDSGTKLQELAVEHTLATVKHDNGNTVDSIEGYGFGKGYQHVSETFLLALAEIDRHIESGRNVILICHAIVDKAPNPEGEDHSQYQLALQQPPKNGQIRTRVQSWCHHLLFVNYDKAVKDGKGKGQGTRQIYVSERPAYWAKSRTLREPVEFVDPLVDPVAAAEVWRQLGMK